MPDLAYATIEFIDLAGPLDINVYTELAYSKIELFDGSANYVPDTAAPVLSNFVPPLGTGIYAGSSLQFDATDNSGLFRTIAVLANYPDGTYEVVHDGLVFANAFSGSLLTAIAGGFRFVLLRTNGWPGSPSLRVIAIDQSGSQAST